MYKYTINGDVVTPKQLSEHLREQEVKAYLKTITVDPKITFRCVPLSCFDQTELRKILTDVAGMGKSLY